jgi:hypothetical protein
MFTEITTGKMKFELEGSLSAQIKLNDVLPLIECNLTIEEVAEKLGLPVEAACALVVASLRGSGRARGTQ